MRWSSPVSHTRTIMLKKRAANMKADLQSTHAIKRACLSVQPLTGTMVTSTMPTRKVLTAFMIPWPACSRLGNPQRFLCKHKVVISDTTHSSAQTTTSGRCTALRLWFCHSGIPQGLGCFVPEWCILGSNGLFQT